MITILLISAVCLLGLGLIVFERFGVFTLFLCGYGVYYHFWQENLWRKVKTIVIGYYVFFGTKEANKIQTELKEESEQ